MLKGIVMRIFLLWLFLPVVLFHVIGCNVPPTKSSYRSSVELGMTLPQVWFAANKPRFDLVSESLINGCKEEIYRFWFDHPGDNKNGNPTVNHIMNSLAIAAAANSGKTYNATTTKYDPYLLTFRDCAITEYTAVSTERKRRADAWLTSNPDMAKEVEKLSQEEGFSQTNKETLIELLAPDIFNGLPRPGAGSVLVKIVYDAESVSGIQNQQYRQQYIEHLKKMEDLKKQELQDQRFERLTPKRIIPDGRGGYIIH